MRKLVEQFERKKRKRNIGILSLVVGLTLVFSLIGTVVPKIMAGDTVVSDLVLQAETKEKLIFLTVKDENPEDTKIVVPLPEGVTYISNSNSNISVVHDALSNQLVIDWVEGQTKEVTLQLEAEADGKYDFTARTVRDEEAVSSLPCLVTIQSEVEDGEANEKGQEVSEGGSEVASNETVIAEEVMQSDGEMTRKLPADAHIDDTWTPLSELKIENKIVITDKKPFVDSKYGFYPAYFSESIYKKNGQDITNDVKSKVTSMNNIGDDVSASVIGISLGEKISGKITKKNNATTSLGKGVSFPGVTYIGKTGKGTINDFTTYGHLNYSFDTVLSGQLTLTDFDENEAAGIPLNQITKLYATSENTLYGKVDGGILYVAGGTNNPDWTSPNGMVTILFDDLNNFDLFETNENTGSAINMRPASEGLVNVKKSLGINYFDEEGEEIAPMKLIEGAEGTPYDEKPIDIPGYKYKKLSENSAPASGTFSDSLKNIEFVYEKLIPVKNVTVKYVNTLGEKLDETILSGNIGEEFKTEQKEFPGYTFKKVDGPTTGKFAEQPQSITYTYAANRLRFYNVPSELSFNETKIATSTKTISRKDPDWKIIVEDTRLKKNNWRVTAKLAEQFTDSSGQPLQNDILLFRRGSQSNQWITSDNEINVFSGTSAEEDELYDVSWKANEGPLIQVAPGTVKIGKYTGVINWNLIDAPV